MQPRPTMEIVNGKRYDTEKSDLLAGDDYWDGRNWERHGTNSFLYRTKRNRYFRVIHGEQGLGNRGRLEILTKDEAVTWFTRLSNRRMSLHEAFPGIEVEEA